MHLDKPDSIDNLKSLELNFAYVDQMEDIREEAWDTLQERLGRWSGATKLGGFPENWPFRTEVGDPIPPAYVFVSAYSPGYDHWITRRWWSKGSDREQYRKQGYKVVIGSTRENPNLTGAYKKSRLAMGKEYVERFVDALSWGANEGRIFAISDQSYIEATAELINKIKGSMKLHRVLDPGDFTVTACLWYATDTDGNVFFYREYGEENELVSTHRQKIYELSRLDSFNESEPPIYTSNIADPVIANKTRGRTLDKPPQWSVQDEYTDRRIMDPRTAIFWRKANNDESMTISRVREYLREDPTHRNPITGKMKAPRIYFVMKSHNYPHGLHETITDVIAAKRIEVGQNADGTKQFGDKRDEDVRDHYLDCVAPETRILTSDLRWVQAGDVRPGDRLTGFDENTGGQYNPRRWHTSVVEDFTIIKKPCYRLELSDGSHVVCSYDHQWLTTTKDLSPSQRDWTRTEHLDGQSHFATGRNRGLPAGDRVILKPLDVWNDGGLMEGYLAGVLDGEGHLSRHTQGKGSWSSLGFCQKDNPCLTQSLDFLSQLEFKYSVYGPKNDVFNVKILGGATEQMRFLGQVRPVRLLDKFTPGGRFQCQNHVAVVGREYVGEQWVASIQTSTRTFIAEGLASHNCVRYAIGMRPKGHIRINEYYQLSKDYEEFKEDEAKRNFKGHHDW
jgi:hypothetical protein